VKKGGKRLLERSGIITFVVVALRILNLDIDTGMPTGKLMLNLLGAIAEFERGVMLERQREVSRRRSLTGSTRGGRPSLGQRPNWFSNGCEWAKLATWSPKN